MEGQSGDCPDSGSRAARGADSQCRNGGAVGRLPGQGRYDALEPDPATPQWRGSRETARTCVLRSGTPRARERRNGGAVGRLPGHEAFRQRSGLILRAAMEGQSGDCPDPPSSHVIRRVPYAAMEGQSGDCPDTCPTARLASLPRVPQWRGSRETARTLDMARASVSWDGPQWRGSRETARTPPDGATARYATSRNGGAVGRLPGP